MKALNNSSVVKEDSGDTGWRGLPKICTVAQLANNFRCSRSTIYRNIYHEEWDRDGMWAEKVNGRWRISRSEAAHWFNAPMREAMACLINAACPDDGGPIKVYWWPPQQKLKADSDSEARGASTKTSGRDSLKFTKTNETQ